jgi:hypothetical protein
MNYRIRTLTALTLLAAGGAASAPAIAEAAQPVMNFYRDVAPTAQLKRSTANCVELTQRGLFVQALPHCNSSVSRAQALTTGGAPNVELDVAIARSNRAVLFWMMGRERQATIDLAEAAMLAPDATFVRKNLAVIGEEPPAETLANGETD